MPFLYVDYMMRIMAPKPYPAQPNFDPPQLTHLSKPIEECTLGVLTSCGAQLNDDRTLS
jgi:hypothetical protein